MRRFLSNYFDRLFLEHTVVWRCRLTGDTLTAGVELIPLLIQTLEKATSQLTHVQHVNEAGAVANLITKLLMTHHDLTGISLSYSRCLLFIWNNSRYITHRKLLFTAVYTRYLHDAQLSIHPIRYGSPASLVTSFTMERPLGTSVLYNSQKRSAGQFSQSASLLVCR